MTSKRSDQIPIAPDSEGAVLATLIFERDIPLDILEQITMDLFFLPANRILCEVIIALRARGIMIDPLQIQEEVRARGLLDKATPGHIEHLIHGKVGLSNVQSHIDRLKELARRRQLRAELSKVIDLPTAAEIREGASKIIERDIAPLSRSGEERTPVQWPDALNEIAYHGLAGDLVRAIDPHTEADPAALLVQFLVSFGNLIKRSAHFIAEADRHYCNMFAVVVGNTSKGRKGTSWGQIKSVLGSTDKEWVKNCNSSGLSSGEGLIWQVRDPIEKHEPIKQKGRVIDYQDVITDKGVDDKRLLIVEPEFALVLKTASRDGNTLSAIIRQAWDDGNLRSLTKSSPARATDAHISIIGHITKDELRRYLEDTETANGFANRFLWVCARQSKLLPEGGRLNEVNFGELVRRLNNAADHARKTTEIKRNEQARELWFDVYPDLADGKPGLLGAVTGRAEAQVMRLAAIYALLDCESMIGRIHLEAALALWKYCEDSARYIFGDAMGDPTADSILAALREVGESGLTRTKISDLLNHRIGSAAIGRALESLAEAGRARFIKEKTEGRPIQRWFALTVTAKKANYTKKADSKEFTSRGSCEISEISPEDGDLNSLNSLFSQSAQENGDGEESFGEEDYADYDDSSLAALDR